MARTKARTWRWLTPPEREQIAARLRDGSTIKDLASEFGCSTKTVKRVRTSGR